MLWQGRHSGCLRHPIGSLVRALFCRSLHFCSANKRTIAAGLTMCASFGAPIGCPASFKNLNRIYISDSLHLRREPQRWQRQRQGLRPPQRRSAAAAASSQLEGPLLGVAELLGYTGDDPGHWNFSPEWYGTQGGGWGRDAGTVVFAEDSACGNGCVTVTAHAAVGRPSLKEQQEQQKGGGSSSSGGGGGGTISSSWEEWRVLRFNNVTRQTVMRVSVTAAGSSSSSQSSSGGQVAVVAQPDCLAQEYLKTVASVSAALLGLQRLLPTAGGAEQRSQGQQQPAQRLRALCIGVGGGSLPLFLSHHFPCMDVDAVELDPAVVAAATSAMGLPTTLPNLRLHCADAADFLARRQAGSGPAEAEGQIGGQQAGGEQAPPLYDLVFMDAFDGQDNVPSALCTPEFAALLGSSMHPRHGCFLVNLHSLDGTEPAATFKAGLLGASASSSGHSGTGGGVSCGTDGSCFAVSAQRQRNVCLAVVRGLALPAAQGAAQRLLSAEAVHVALDAGYRFSAGKRASRQLMLL